jgi:large subunit ribosomal protein L20
MPRVKKGTTVRARHKRVLAKTKGYKHGRKNVFRQAKQALLKAKEYSYRSGKTRKRQMRSLWIVRINSACKASNIKYSQFIKGLNDKKIKYTRKELSDMIQKNPKGFEEILKKATS